MKVHKITICVVDHDDVGAEEIPIILENVRYPNRCISPHVISVESREIGPWDDDHPLNNESTFRSALDEIFS
jgi:hypothetical protein